MYIKPRAPPRLLDRLPHTNDTKKNLYLPKLLRSPAATYNLITTPLLLDSGLPVNEEMAITPGHSFQPAGGIPIPV